MVMIRAKTGREAYHPAVTAALQGVRRAPRGRLTRDAGYVVIKLETPYDALPLDCGRSPLPAIAAVEALQLIGGISVPELMFTISPKFRAYVEPHDESFHGAYGNRIKSQMVEVANKLRRDPETRQAVVTMWDPDLDNLRDKKDYPCTIALQFEIDEGRLCMNTIMRSNDVWLGLAYDMFQFTQLQMSLARTLSLADGWYRHTAWSLHAYVDDVDNLVNVHPPRLPASQFQPQGVGREGTPFTETMRRARSILRGETIPEPSISERWYQNILQPYVARLLRREDRDAPVVG